MRKGKIIFMTPSDIITIIATIITVISMVVTIIYAKRAKDYKEQIQFDIRKINLSNVVEKLKRTQDEIRKLPKVEESKRGIKVQNIINIIKSHFDYTLNLLDSDGDDTEIRNFISDAQSSLHSYEVALSTGIFKAEEVIKMTKLMQYAIAKSNTRILIIEKDL